ncbi:hypothetical protein GOA57_05265 [Sinorhizobium meliloti]|nr:hypothetical protein [Sinorhizobium meliloti]
MKRTWRDINWLWVAGVFTAAYAVAICFTLGGARIWKFLTGDTVLNEIGDFLAGVFAPIALIWLVAAVLTQRQELNDTRDQFAENQKVVDAQLKTINSQNALLALQHNQAVENARKAYKLSLFDKRFEIYQKFITLGSMFKSRDLDDSSYWEMVSLSHEASFVFDHEFEEWLSNIAEQIADYVTFKKLNPFERGPDGYGNTVVLSNQRNVELQEAYNERADAIRELFRPEERIERFWRYLNVSDQPLVG